MADLMTIPLKIKRGKFTAYRNEIEKLIVKHWAETGIPGADGLSIDIDMEVYERLEDLDQHLGLGIFEEGELEDTLIGYASFMIYSHHQHKTKKFAQTDGFFVDPSKRGFRTFRTVCKMFKEAETILKQEYSVEYLYLGTNAQNDLKFLAECLQFTPASVNYVKRL